jgi:hypothetical protein
MTRISINILLTCLGLAAWAQIGISAIGQEPNTPPTIYDYVHTSLLFCSVVYIHWALRTFLMSFRGVPKEHIPDIRQAINTKYARGFLSGTISFGYLLLIIHTIAFLDRSVSHRPNFLFGAIFFIVLGILAQARAAIQYLCQVYSKEIKSIDP